MCSHSTQTPPHMRTLPGPCLPCLRETWPQQQRWSLSSFLSHPCHPITWCLLSPRAMLMRLMLQFTSAVDLLEITLLCPGRFLLACLPVYLNLTCKSGSGVKSWLCCLLVHKNLPLNVNKIWDKLVPYGHKCTENTECAVDTGRVIAGRVMSARLNYPWFSEQT